MGNLVGGGKRFAVVALVTLLPDPRSPMRAPKGFGQPPGPSLTLIAFHVSKASALTEILFMEGSPAFLKSVAISILLVLFTFRILHAASLITTCILATVLFTGSASDSLGVTVAAAAYPSFPVRRESLILAQS